MQKQRKFQITSSLFIIYLHNELQTCRGPQNLLVGKISGILVFAFGHQGASKYKKNGEKMMNQNNISSVHILLT